jgi:hypothetical protein
MSPILALIAALIVVVIASPEYEAVAGDCQASCQLTLARCIQSGGSSCSKTWRSCVADKGCEGAYGLAREAGTADTPAPQASPRERSAPAGAEHAGSSAPPAAGGPPPRQPAKGSRWVPAPPF